MKLLKDDVNMVLLNLHQPGSVDLKQISPKRLASIMKKVVLHGLVDQTTKKLTKFGEKYLTKVSPPQPVPDLQPSDGPAPYDPKWEGLDQVTEDESEPEKNKKKKKKE